MRVRQIKWKEVKEEEDASPNLSANKALQGRAFDAAFGLAGDPEEDYCRLEQRRRQLLSQDLEGSYEQVQACSALTKHLWGHYKELPHFATPGDLYAHARKNITVEILYTAPLIQLNKTFGTKSCRLCMAKKSNLFVAFGKQKKKKQKKKKCSNLMNVKTELYGVCDCKAGFSRLRHVEHRGADEVTG